MTPQQRHPPQKKPMAAPKKTESRPPPKRRAADLAYDAIETLLSTMQLEPGSQIAEADLAERTGLGRTPVREALLRMVSIGLIVQQPQPRPAGVEHRPGRPPRRHPDAARARAR
jgi:hypothetical protein